MRVFTLIIGYISMHIHLSVLFLFLYHENITHHVKNLLCGIDYTLGQFQIKTSHL